MTDRYGRNIDYLRLSVTERCNLRCRYCMPEDESCAGRSRASLGDEEMLLAVRAAVSLGIRKVRVTGGEPLVKKNILSLCRGISELPGVGELCMTTNGVLLSKLAGGLRKAGVSRVNISLDTLKPERYRYMTRGGSFEDAWAGLLAALDAGFEKVKINAVLIGGFNGDEIAELAELTRKYPVDVRFIEWMPMEGSEALFAAKREMSPARPAAGGEVRFANSLSESEKIQLPCSRVPEQLSEAVPIGADGGVAKLYRLPGALGNIGLIAPVSGQFCKNCSRLRLSADGMIKPCLHSAEEFPVKGLDFEGMRAQFLRAAAQKPPCHSGLLGQKSGAGRAMNRIGG